MEHEMIDLTGALIVAGIIFWLFGGADWVSEKNRQLKLENDAREAALKASSQSPEKQSVSDA